MPDEKMHHLKHTNHEQKMGKYWEKSNSIKRTTTPTKRCTKRHKIRNEMGKNIRHKNDTLYNILPDKAKFLMSIKALMSFK